MAEVKKAAAEKTAAKSAAVPAADTKEEVKEVKEAPKAETTQVKETAVKTAGRKPAVKATVEIQFAGNTHTPEELVQSAKDIWEYDLHRAPADFKTVELYVKPEDNKVYYVINKGSENEVNGDFNF